METRAGRAVRAWTVAVVATFLAAVSHGLADGMFPSLLGLGASVVLAGAACTILTPRGQSLWRLALAVALSQVAFHTLFASFGVGTTTAAGHTHAGMDGPTALNAALSAASPAHGHTTMVVAHVVAGVLTLALLRTAESGAVALGRVIRLVARRLLNPVDAPTPLGVVRVGPAERALPPLRSLLSLAPARYRGPPVLAPVA